MIAVEKCVFYESVISTVKFSTPIRNFARKSMELSELFFVLTVGNFFSKRKKKMRHPFFLSKDRSLKLEKKSIMSTFKLSEIIEGKREKILKNMTFL